MLLTYWHTFAVLRLYDTVKSLTLRLHIYMDCHPWTIQIALYTVLPIYLEGSTTQKGVT